jgi:predicted transcriptional regulator
VTFRLAPKTIERLDFLAKQTGMRKTALLEYAIKPLRLRSEAISERERKRPLFEPAVQV